MRAPSIRGFLIEVVVAADSGTFWCPAPARLEILFPANCTTALSEMFRFDATLCHFVGIFLAPSRAPSPITFGILLHRDHHGRHFVRALRHPRIAGGHGETIAQHLLFSFSLLSPSAKARAFLAVG